MIDRQPAERLEQRPDREREATAHPMRLVSSSTKLFSGPLEAIAKECGFEDKLAHLVTGTPFREFVQEGSDCQYAWLTACIAETPSPGNGAASSNTRAASLKDQ